MFISFLLLEHSVWSLGVGQTIRKKKKRKIEKKRIENEKLIQAVSNPGKEERKALRSARVRYNPAEYLLCAVQSDERPRPYSTTKAWSVL